MLLPVLEETTETTRCRTIERAIDIEGTGIHSGAPCRVRLSPQEPGHGIRFCRNGGEVVPATEQFARAVLSDRRTVIVGPGGEFFEQIEHLMAALSACGISDVLVEQEGPEVPFLGGGAREFMEALREVGTRQTEGTQPVIVVTRPLSFEDGDAMMVATPHEGLRLSVFVEFPGTIVGNDGYSLEITEDAFFQEASLARTFARHKDLELLKQAGLIKGGSLDNAVVFDHDRYYNESLHYPNEVVRHKIIDLLGDLALLGRPLRGHIWAWRSGHRSHVLFAQHLAKEIR